MSVDLKAAPVDWSGTRDTQVESTAFSRQMANERSAKQTRNHYQENGMESSGSYKPSKIETDKRIKTTSKNKL